MTAEFAVTIASDAEHEKVFAEIYYQEKFVALVSQEDGLDRLKIEFPSIHVDESMVLREVNMENFQQALIFAAKKLTGQIP